jgi:hypothetical protein
MNIAAIILIWIAIVATTIGVIIFVRRRRNSPPTTASTATAPAAAQAHGTGHGGGHGAGHGVVYPDTTPSDAKRVGRVMALVGWILLAIVLLVGLGVVIRVGRWTFAPPAPPRRTYSAMTHRVPEPPPASHGDLRLMGTCTTPCGFNIQFKAKIRTDGDPLGIKFQKVSRVFHHPGKGYAVAPPGADVGWTAYVSDDPKNEHVLVWTYKVL